MVPRTPHETVAAAGMKPGMVINPRTPLSHIEPFLDSVRIIMFMGHTPGYENVGIEKGVLQKIRYIKRECRTHVIEVDGGVTDKTAPRFIAAGATRLSVGSYISASSNPKKALAELKKIK